MRDLKEQINEQTERTQTPRHRGQSWGCQRGRGLGGLKEEGGGIEKHTGAGTEQPQAAKSSPGNTVGNIVIPERGTRWVLDLPGGSLCKLQKCLTPALSNQNSHRIKCQLELKEKDPEPFAPRGHLVVLVKNTQNAHSK